MMNILKNNILFLALLVGLTCNAQEKDIDKIIFNYSSARRIPFSSVSIQIFKRADGNSAFALVHCDPANDDKKWQYSKIDTIYDINIEKFNHLESQVILLEKIDLDKAYKEGFDGSTCKIEFAGKGRGTSYAFWIPKSKTTERGLNVFVELCEEIIAMVRLDLKEILEK